MLQKVTKPDAVNVLAALSPRERQVLLMVERGMPYSQVAERLRIARGTALSLGKRAYRKLLGCSPLTLGNSGALSTPPAVRHHALSLVQAATENRAGRGKHRARRGTAKGARHPHKGGSLAAAKHAARRRIAKMLGPGMQT